MRRAAVLTALVLAVAACDRPRAPGEEGEAPAGRITGFAHNQTADLSGYYLPTTPVVQGPYRLDRLFIAHAGDFAAWEGGARSEGFAPLMLEFADTRSPVGPDGGHQIRVRVPARAYAVSDASVRFVGSAPELGETRFEGAVDLGALAEARRNLGGREAPVLEGVLTIKGQAHRDLAFNWWMGD